MNTQIIIYGVSNNNDYREHLHTHLSNYNRVCK